MSVEETLKRHEAILDRLAGERGYRVTKTYYEVVSGESIAARPEIKSCWRRSTQDCTPGCWW